MAANSTLPGRVYSVLHIRVALRDPRDSLFWWTFKSGMLSQTSMYSAFGNPQGTVAMVHTDQVILSIRTKLQKRHEIEALFRAKFKFPGCQKIHISKDQRFTKFNADEFESMVAEKWLIPDGYRVKYNLIVVPWKNGGLALTRALALSLPYSCPQINPILLSKKKKEFSCFLRFSLWRREGGVDLGI